MIVVVCMCNLPAIRAALLVIELHNPTTRRRLLRKERALDQSLDRAVPLSYSSSMRSVLRAAHKSVKCIKCIQPAAQYQHTSTCIKSLVYFSRHLRLSLSLSCFLCRRSSKAMTTAKTTTTTTTAKGADTIKQ